MSAAPPNTPRAQKGKWRLGEQEAPPSALTNLSVAVLGASKRSKLFKLLIEMKPQPSVKLLINQFEVLSSSFWPLLLVWHLEL